MRAAGAVLAAPPAEVHALVVRRYVYQDETGEEARLAPVTVEVPVNQSIPYLKRRLEHVSFGGHQVWPSRTRSITPLYQDTTR